MSELLTEWNAAKAGLAKSAAVSQPTTPNYESTSISDLWAEVVKEAAKGKLGVLTTAERILQKARVPANASSSAVKSVGSASRKIEGSAGKLPPKIVRKGPVTPTVSAERATGSSAQRSAEKAVESGPAAAAAHAKKVTAPVTATAPVVAPKAKTWQDTLRGIPSAAVGKWNALSPGARTAAKGTAVAGGLGLSNLQGRSAGREDGLEEGGAQGFDMGLDQGMRVGSQQAAMDPGVLGRLMEVFTGRQAGPTGIAEAEAAQLRQAAIKRILAGQ